MKNVAEQPDGKGSADSSWPSTPLVVGGLSLTLFLGMSLAFCFIAVVFCLLLLLFLGLNSLFTGSQPYQTALRRANQNPQVQQRLGTPVKANWFITGEIDNSANGFCDLHIPVSGPKGSGEILVRGSAVDGVWTYEEMSLQIEGETIELRTEDRATVEGSESVSATIPKANSSAHRPDPVHDVNEDPCPLAPRTLAFSSTRAAKCWEAGSIRTWRCDRSPGSRLNRDKNRPVSVRQSSGDS